MGRSASHIIALYGVSALFDSFLWSAPVGDAAWHIGILNRKAAVIHFRKRIDRKQVGLNEGLIDLHCVLLLC